MLILQNIAYRHPNKDLLFEEINLIINKQNKAALIGNNGVGKSTLLKVIAGISVPSAGLVTADSKPYYIPQLYGQFNDLTVSQALQVESKLTALEEILAGNVTDTNMSVLGDDWTIGERCHEAMSYWQLEGVDLNQQIEKLSGGQKTKVLLAGISIHQPEIVLLDEPSNHLDKAARNLLYEFVLASQASIVLVSHDRTLLNLLDTVYELSKRGITAYGGNYDFYTEQKLLEAEALNQDLKSKEKALRKAKEVERETTERKQKLDARGRKKQEKAGLPTILMNTLRNSAEKSTSRLKSMHSEKVGSISDELNELRKELPEADKIKFGFDDSALHKGKILVKAKDINYGYGSQLLWNQPLDFEIASGQRIAVRGSNGSGKTTLIKMVLGEFEAKTGTIYRAESRTVYIDQDYSLINSQLNVYEQSQRFNNSGLQEHEIKIRLARFLFKKEFWNESCDSLSGGEKMRLILCCLTIGSQAPDIIILDEPTNNLDIQNIEILTAAINQYKGTLLVVSHDEYFLQQVNIERTIDLDPVYV